MRIPLLSAVLVLMLHSVSVQAVGPGQQAPAWTGQDLVSEQAVAFPEVLEGKPAVLIFWATWCPYCKAFMPYARQIEQDYADQGVKIITFNAKERGRGDAAAYVESLGYPMIAIESADAIADDYGIDFIPGLLVVDGSGEVVYRRRSTNLPAGRTVSQQWALEVSQVLDELTR